MKKTLISALLLVVAVAASVVFQPGKHPAPPQNNTSEQSNSVVPGSDVYTSQLNDDSEDYGKSFEPPAPSERTIEGVLLADGVTMGDAPAGYFEEALFVGDSRMNGLQLYGDIKEASWYAATSMSVYNYNDKQVDVQGVGVTSLDNLLSQKKYKRIYVNMGINEIGYDMEYLKNTYTEFYNKLRTMQPDAKIIIMSNLHVTKAYSDTSTNGITNPRLNELNEHLKAMQDGEHIFYLDTNHLFDDANGALAAECTGDGVHVFAQQYLDISAYLRSHAIY